jgi:cyclic-di-GMP phosphodiesterase TipF (flagellum assembly factor)
MDIDRYRANHCYRAGKASMLRLGAIFIVLCMVLIAASVGAVLYLLVGLNASESMIVAVAILTGLAIYHAVTSRLHDRFDIGGQIADLSRGTGDLARQVAELSRRTAALEGQGDKIIDGAAERAAAAARRSPASSPRSQTW